MANHDPKDKTHDDHGDHAGAVVAHDDHGHGHGVSAGEIIPESSPQDWMLVHLMCPLALCGFFLMVLMMYQSWSNASELRLLEGPAHESSEGAPAHGSKSPHGEAQHNAAEHNASEPAAVDSHGAAGPAAEQPAHTHDSSPTENSSGSGTETSAGH